MAPSRTPRKGQSSTLHDFFGKTSQARRKPAPHRPPSEIIVIGSDDDESYPSNQLPISDATQESPSSFPGLIHASSSSLLASSSHSTMQVPRSVYQFGRPSSLLSSSNSFCIPDEFNGSIQSLEPSKTRDQQLLITTYAPPSELNPIHSLLTEADGDEQPNSVDCLREELVWCTDDDEVVPEFSEPEVPDSANVAHGCGELATTPCPSGSHSLLQKPASSSQLANRWPPPIPPTNKPVENGAKQESRNAFSLLMTGNSDDAAWKEADTVEDRRLGSSAGNSGRRKAPFYKVLSGMPIAVDAFRYGAIPGVKAYFLTHAHSDHYTNLSSSWNHGSIYASEATANLIIHMLGVDRRWIHPLPMNTPCEIPQTGGVTVTLIDANHCPGSCLFFFEGKQTRNAGDSAYPSPHIGTERIFRYLHCGDFRASPQHVKHPQIQGKRIDCIYLDTTYLDPRYTFPPQTLVVNACADLVKQIRSRGHAITKSPSIASWVVAGGPTSIPQNSLRLLVIVGTYTIGKERIVKAIAQALESKIYCDNRKAAILRCQPDPDLHALLTNDPFKAQVHVLPLAMLATDKLKGYVERFAGTFDKVVGFRPTGWTFHTPQGTNLELPIPSVITKCQAKTFTSADLQPSRNSTPMIQLYPVPYSEHSSFFELTAFALSLNWAKIIATVNVGNEKSRAKMSKWVDRWQKERQKRTTDVVPFRHLEFW